MTEEKRQLIEKLAAIAYQKRSVYLMHQQANTPADYKEALSAAQEYAVAQAESFEADRALLVATYAIQDIQTLTQNAIEEMFNGNHDVRNETEL